MTSLLFLLGEERDRQPRTVYKYWAPCRLCCVEIFFTVNNGHWFSIHVLLVLEVVSLVQLTSALWVYGHSVRPGLRFIPSPSLGGDGFSDVLTAYGPSFLAATFLVSSPEEYSCAEFFWEIPSGNIPYSALFGSTVDTCLLQLTRCVVRWCSKLWLSRSCISSKVVDFPVVPQRLIPMVLSTMVITQLQFLDKVIDDSVVRVVQVFPSRSHARCVQRRVPWLRSAVSAHLQGRLHCRGAEFDPYGFSVQQTTEMPLLPYTWWSMSLSLVVRVSTGAVVEETVAHPQLQLLRSSPDVVNIPVVA